MSASCASASMVNFWLWRNRRMARPSAALVGARAGVVVPARCRDGSHLSDDLAEADGGAGGEHELAVAVDQSGTVEPVHRVELRRLGCRVRG